MWWFSNTGVARFDLAPPRGTCYWAERPLGSFVEVFRDHARLLESDVASRSLTTGRIASRLVLADCTQRRARAFGITGAIHSSENYSLTQRWAEHFAAHGFDGIRYYVSHDPAQRLVGIALFGSGGHDVPSWRLATDPIPATILAAAERHFGTRVLSEPYP